MTAVIMVMRSANGMGLPLDQLTYIISGSHLKWTEPGARLRATESGEYVARNVVPARLAMRHDGSMYLAMPRFRNGVPFTLGTIEYDPCQSTVEPPISPYPCEAAHRPNRVPNNWTLVNVVDVYLDDNGVLWTLDVGKVNMLDAVAVVRPPMVFAFDTETDLVLYNIIQYRHLKTHNVCHVHFSKCRPITKEVRHVWHDSYCAIHVFMFYFVNVARIHVHIRFVCTIHLLKSRRTYNLFGFCVF